MDNLFEDYMAARCRIKALERTIEEFKSGKRYFKLQKDYHRVASGYIKEIKRLKQEIGHLNAHIISIRNMWSDDYYSMYEEKQAEIGNLKETIRRLEDKIWEERRNSDEKIVKLTHGSCTITALSTITRSSASRILNAISTEKETARRIRMILGINGRPM